MLLRVITQSDRFFSIPFLVSIFFSLTLFFIFFILYDRLPNKLPLFYSLSWGENQLVAKQQFLLLPALIIIIMLVNMMIAWQIHPSQIVLRRISLMSTLVVDVIIMTTAIKIIRIFF